MKYTMNTWVMDIIMPEAKRLGIPWHELMDKLVLDYAANVTKGSDNNGKTEESEGIQN